MLKSVNVRNFKSYRDATLPLSELTVLIGANASGKSNLIEALQVLSWLAHGRRLGDLLHAVNERELSVRGAAAEWAHQGAASFALGCELDDQGGQLSFRTEIRTEETGWRIHDEELADPLGWSWFPLYRVQARWAPSTLSVAYNNFARGGRKPQISCIDQQAVFTQLTSPAPFRDRESQKVIPAAAARLQGALENVLFLDPIPQKMRAYSFEVEKRLHGDGSTLSSVVFDLCDRQKRADELLAFVRSLPEQDIAGVGFLHGPRREVMLSLEETFGSHHQRFEAARLSDGTLRVLAVAAALLSVPEGALVVIEEIDNGVHPPRARHLLEQIQRVARTRRLRVLLTTHNPALLDAIPDEAVPNLVACYRDPHSGDSRLVRLEDLPDYPQLVAQGRIGRLVTSGVVDRFLKHRPAVGEYQRRWREVLSGIEEEDKAS